MALAPGARLGSYEITAHIGAGGMGEVYRATDRILKRQVALKVLPEILAADGERLARLQREAEVLASLNHPNIAAIYGLERANGTLAIVMELVDGPTLADRIAERAIPVDEAVSIVRQIAEALEAAHEQGIIHRDLKPANIKVRPDGTVKLLDFGLAKPLDRLEDAASGDATRISDSRIMTSPAMMTQFGTVIGTAAYMAPEQANGRPADKRSDIWAFGVVVAEMSSGHRIFDGGTIAETMAAVLTREPELDAVPPEFKRLVRLCLIKDPRKRLRHIGDAPALIERSSPSTSSQSTRRIDVWAYATLLVILAAVAGSLGAWSFRRRASIEEPITKFYVDAPRDAAFNYTYTASAVSPDGREIVFRVATATEAPALWIRPLDDLAGRRISGTEGADFPFWSADGRSLGFFSAGKLKRVDLTGGSPIVLCDASDADATLASASWNRDGVIIFGTSEGVYRVSASGGTPVLIARINSASGETGYGSVQFLADGDRFLMFVRSNKPEQSGYYVSSLSQADRKTLLLATKTKAIYVANEGGDSSYLLYLQDRTLLARHLDSRTLSLTGDPVPIATDVAVFPPGFQASFWSSASGNVLAYRTEASDKPRLTWIYPDGKHQAVTGTEDFYTYVRVSADGARAAMDLADGTGNLDIWTWDFARGVKTRQTFDPKPDRAATWAPNGHELAFSSLRTGVWQLYRKNVDNGEPDEQLTSGPEDKIAPEWSRDGRYLMFIQIGTTTAEDIFAISLEGGDRHPFPVLQTPAIETNPALSPDGKWLAFESSYTGRPEVYAMRFPSSQNPTTATPPRWQVSTQGGSRPRWSGDGRALYYVSLDDTRIMKAEIHATAATFESDAPHPFAEIPVMSVTRAPFDVAKDGRLLVLERTISQGVPLAIITNWRTLMSAR